LRPSLNASRRLDPPDQRPLNDTLDGDFYSSLHDAIDEDLLHWRKETSKHDPNHNPEHPSKLGPLSMRNSFFSFTH
jgi:hypothetical protein